MDEDDQKPHVSLRELIKQRALEKKPTVTKATARVAKTIAKKERSKPPLEKKKKRKGAPQEVSSYKRRGVAPPQKKNAERGLPERPARARDPRFMDSSGQLDTTAFSQAYKFLEGYRKDELSMLTAQAAQASRDGDEEAATALRKEIYARKQQDAMRARKVKVSAQLSKLRKEEAEKVKQGKKPFYHSKQHAQQKMLEEQYKDASPAVVEKAVAKKRKVAASKARKLLPKTRRSADAPG